MHDDDATPFSSGSVALATPPARERRLGGVFDLMSRLAQSRPDPEAMGELIDETDRIDDETQDDPTPQVPFLQLADEDIQEVFRGRLRQAAAFRAPLETAWRKAFADYNQQIDAAVNVWRSKVKLPYVRALVLAAIPAGLAAAFDSGTILRILPQHPEFEKNAESMETLLQWQLTVKTQARKAFRHFLHNRSLYGTGVMKTGWRYATRMMMVTEPVYDETDDYGQPLPPGEQGAYLGNRRVLKAVETHNEPLLESVDLWNCYPAPWTRLGHTPYFIERIETTREELLDAVRAGAYGTEAGLDKDGNPQTPEEAVTTWFALNPTMNLLDGTDEHDMGARAAVLQSIGYASPYTEASSSGTENEPGPNPVVVFEYWTQDVKILFSGDGSRLILGKQPNPLELHDLPYVISQYDEILPGLVWGCGIGMAAGPIQTQLDFDINHANDGRRLALNPVLKRKRLGSSLMGDITIKPGSIIDVYDQDDIEQLELKDRTANAIEWTMMLVGFGDRSTGIGDMQRGIPDKGVNTATEASILDSNAITRKLAHVFEIRDVWQQLGRQLIALNKQFFDAETMIRVAGAPGMAWTFKRIGPADIFGEYDVVPGASMTRSDVVLQRRDWHEHFTKFNGDPLTNQHELRRRYWSAFDQERVDDLLAPLPPPPANPADEEIALQHGLTVPVSPDEDFAAHIATHAAALLELQAVPPEQQDSRAITAHERHLEDTYRKQAEVRQQMMLGAATATSSGGRTGADGAPGAGKTRDKATMLGQSQGSNGSGGDAPGPKAPPGRPVRSVP